MVVQTPHLHPLLTTITSSVPPLSTEHGLPVFSLISLQHIPSFPPSIIYLLMKVAPVAGPKVGAWVSLSSGFPGASLLFYQIFFFTIFMGSEQKDFLLFPLSKDTHDLFSWVVFM